MVAFDARHLIAVNRMGCSIVICGIDVTRNVHDHDTRRHNLQPTVAHIEGDVEVVVSVGELVSGKTHVVNAGRGTGSDSRAAEGHHARGVIQ